MEDRMNIIKRVLDGDYAGLKGDVEKFAGEKIKKRIAEKKIDVLSNLNGVAREQMEEVLAIVKDQD
jgi:hypothetical protein